jgi:hypothetical protein
MMAEEQRGARRWLRLLAMALVAGLLWWGYREEPEEIPAAPIDPAEAAGRYAAEFSPAEGRSLKEICFARTFRGEPGEGLYAVWEVGDGDARQAVVEKYVLMMQSGDYGFTYKTTFEQLRLPESRFVRYTEKDGVWQAEQP